MAHTRWLLVLACLLAAGLAFGGAEQEGAAAAERLTISWMGPNNRGVLLPPDSPTELYLEEYFDVELEPWTDVDLYQSDQWKTRIASGDIPDYIKADAIGSGLHDIGAVRVLSEELLRQHMPNYTKLIDQIAGRYGWQTVTSGGEVVGIPSVNVAIASGATFVTRRDWLEAVGEPLPEKRMLGSPYSDYSSLEDVERLLRKYRNEDPDGNGQKDTYGISVYKNSNTVSFNAGAQWAFPNEFGAHGVRLASWQDIGGELHYSMISDGYKEALAFLHRWYEEEIIDPEFVTDKRSELITKFSNGIVGAFQASPAWTGPRPSGPTGVLLKNVPETELVYFIAYEGPGGKASVNFNPILGNTSIGANASDAVTEKLLAMLDEIHTNMELYGRVAYGEEGVNYEWDEDGLLIKKPGFGTGEERTNQGWQYFTMWEHHHARHLALPAAALAHHSAHHRHRPPKLDNGFVPQWDEELRGVASQLREVESEYFFRAIIGQANFSSDWDAYVDEWTRRGGDRLTEEGHPPVESLDVTIAYADVNAPGCNAVRGVSVAQSVAVPVVLPQ